MINFTCPICNNTIKIKNYLKDSKKTCSRKCDSVRKKIIYTGENNPFYGKTHTPEAIKKIKKADRSFTQEDWYKQKVSKISKEKGCGGSKYIDVWKSKGEEYFQEKMSLKRTRNSLAAKGINNSMYGKPSPSKSGTGWSGWYNGWYFRSLRELSFMLEVIEQYNFQWKTAENNDLRIPYMHYNGSERTYTADFLIENKYLVEIKPYRLIHTPLITIKTNAAIEFCYKNGLIFVITDIDINHNKIIKMYQDKTLKLTERTTKLMEDYLCQG